MSRLSQDRRLCFLDAHVIPQEYKGRSEENVDTVVKEMLPQAVKEGALFCDEGAFTLAQSRRVLEAARTWGMSLKIHADEFEALGGAALAAELGATSADHLICTPEEE